MGFSKTPENNFYNQDFTSVTLNQQLIDEKDELVKLVQEHMGWHKSKAEEWFSIRNPMLGNVQPLALIIVGRGEKLKRFILNAIEGNIA